MNECAILCSNQYKNEARQYSKVRIEPKINVILWNDKTMSDLAQYHYGSIILPVEATLVVTPIQNNHFTLWLGTNTKLITKTITTYNSYKKGHIN